MGVCGDLGVCDDLGVFWCSGGVLGILVFDLLRPFPVGLV